MAAQRHPLKNRNQFLDRTGRVKEKEKTDTSGKIAPHPAPLVLHSSGTADVLHTTTPAISTTDTANGNQNLYTSPSANNDDKNKRRIVFSPPQDLGHLLEEIRSLDFLLRRRPRHVVRKQMSQHGLPDRDAQSSKEKEAGRQPQSHSEQKRKINTHKNGIQVTFSTNPANYPVVRHKRKAHKARKARTSSFSPNRYSSNVYPRFPAPKKTTVVASHTSKLWM